MKKDRIVSEVLGEELAVTPSDLYSTEFKNALMGGYDKEEVDAFLEKTADAFEALIEQVRRLKSEREEHRNQAQEFQEMERTLRNALVSSQRFAENLLDAARREADLIQEEAELIREEARLDARRVPEGLLAEVRALKAERDHLRADLMAILETHRALAERIPSATDRFEAVATVRPALPLEEESES